MESSAFLEDPFNDMPTFAEFLPELTKRIKAHLARGGELVVILDVDGCLTYNIDDPKQDFAAEPKRVDVRDEAVEAIDILYSRKQVTVMIISGRKAEDLAHLMRNIPSDIELHSAYGAVSRVDNKWIPDEHLAGPKMQKALQIGLELFESKVTQLAELENLPTEGGAGRVSETKQEAKGHVWAEVKDGSRSYHFTDNEWKVNPQQKAILLQAREETAAQLHQLGLEATLHGGAVEVGLPYNKLTVITNKNFNENTMFLQLDDDAGGERLMQYIAREHKGFGIAVRQPHTPPGLVKSPETGKPVAAAWANGSLDACENLKQLANDLTS